MKSIVLTDSCYWLGLVDKSDQHHKTSVAIAELIKDKQIIIPWPCMFESVSTRLVRNRQRTKWFEEAICKPEVSLFDDEKYRKIALFQVFEKSKICGTSYSLTDSVVREILKDKEAAVKYLVTYNERDFMDVCDAKNIHLISP